MDNKLALPETVGSVLEISQTTNRAKLAQLINATANTLSFDGIIRQAKARDKEGKAILPTLSGLIAKNGYNELKRTSATISVVLKRFIKSNFQNSDEQIQDIVYDFTSDVLANHADLTIHDIIFFTKYIRQNYGRKDELRDFTVYGQIITALKLAEFFRYYLEDRVVAHENYLALEKSGMNATRDTDANTKFIVRISETAFAKLTVDGKTILVEEVERKIATPITFSSAYKLSQWLQSTGASGSIIKYGENKQSLSDFIKQKLPNFFLEQEQPEQVTHAEKLDKKRSEQILKFISNCEELNTKQKKQLAKEVADTAKRWETRHARDKELSPQTEFRKK